MWYYREMSNPLDNIRQALEREVPDMRTGDTFGILFGMLFSAFLLVLFTNGLFYLFIEGLSPVFIPVISAASLVGSYFVGKALSGSDDVLGAELANDATELAASSNYYSPRRDFAETGIQIGMALMFFHMLVGSMYGTVQYLQKRGTLKDSKDSIVAAHMVHHLITKGPTKQEKLFRLEVLSGFTEQEKRDAAKALTTSGIVDALPTGLQLSPPKRHLFDV